MTGICELSALEARRLIGARKLSPVELLEACIARIEKVDASLNAITAMDVDGARKAARAAEADVKAGASLDLLHGLPIGVKDLEATAGLRTTYGSLLYKDNVPEADQLSVTNVRDAGGVILCKTNVPEFGFGANTKNRVFGPTGNPFDPKLTCAGSSGGSAVALSVGMVPLATGSDYGGSLRTPSAFCGVVGFRPSPGLVPSIDKPAGLMPWSVLGPMGRSVADAHLLLLAQMDIDKRDPFSSDDITRIPDALTGLDPAAVRVAFSTDLGCCPVDKDIAKVFRKKVARFKGVFAEAQDRDPDFGPDIHEVFEVLRGLAAVAAHRERLEKHRDQLGPNVIDNTERGLKYSLADVAWAQVEQARIMKRFMGLFDEVDVVIAPAASVSPFPHDELYVKEINGEKMPTYMRWLSIAYAPTMAMACSICLPCGLDHKGMPFGIQVMGPLGTDAVVLEVAYALEQVLAADKETARPLPDLDKLTTRKKKKATA